VANLFDQFLATQGRMAQNDALAMDNKLTLAKIGQIERAQKMQDDTLAMYKADAQPKLTLANMSEMRDVPDANLESQGKTAQEPVAPPKQKSVAEQIVSAAEEADRLSKKLQTVNPVEAEKQRRERDNLYLKAAPLLKEDRLAKIEEGNMVSQYLGAVKDDLSLNAQMANIQRLNPEMYKAWAELKLPNGAPAFPRNLDGSFAYTPQTKAIAESVSNASMKRNEQLLADDRLADNKQKELEFEQKKRADDEAVRHNKANEANAREGNVVRAKAVAARTGANATTLTPEAIQAEAEAYNTGKAMPTRLDPATRLAIIQKATDLKLAAGESTADRPAKQAEFKANSQALTSIAKDLSAITPYKEMLDTNIGVAKSLAKNAIATDSRLANRSINWLRQNATDNPDVAEYLAQIHFVSTESARVLTNPRLVGQLTDSAISDMKSVISGDMPLNATIRVLDRIESDGNNRVKAMEDQHGRLMKKMSGTKSDGKMQNPEKSIPSIKTDADYTALKPGTQYIAPDGSTRTKK